MKKYLTPEVKSFIKAHLKDDVKALALKKSPFDDVPYKWVLEQISGRQKGALKLIEWVGNEDIIMPPQLSYEQSSSHDTANYKSKLIQKGSRVLDMTGGYGVDDSAFAKIASEVIYCERNKELADIVRHNFEILGSKNIKVYCGDSLAFLKDQKSDSIDLIYMDPARRNDNNKKMVGFMDCEPNPIELKKQCAVISKRMLVKASPMIDISLACNQLSGVERVYVIAVKDELKEVLFDIDLRALSDQVPQITAVNLGKSHQELVFDSIGESQAEVEYSEPLKFIYEPNVALLKSGCFRYLAQYFKVEKIAQHSHLYTSNHFLDFPGRSFEVVRILSGNKKDISRHIPSGKANITTRNFPLSVEQLRKKLRLKDGGDDYIIATSLNNKKPVILQCRKTTGF